MDDQPESDPVPPSRYDLPVFGPRKPGRPKGTGTVFGAIEPMTTAQGAPFPPEMRVQQVGLGVLRLLVKRLDAAFAGGNIKLAGRSLGAAEKAVIKLNVLARMFPEVFGDPIPAHVKPPTGIASQKARVMIARRIESAFTEEFRVDGLSLTADQTAELMWYLYCELVPEVQDHEMRIVKAPKPSPSQAKPVPPQDTPQEKTQSS